MSRAQVERWAQDHPTCPRTGHYLEVPLSYLAPRVLGVIGAAGLLWYANYQVNWNVKPKTLDPEFVKEAQRVGNVAQRMNAPPVFLNPFSNRLSGGILGPEDVKQNE